MTRARLFTAVLVAVAAAGAGTSAGIADPTGPNLVRPIKANQTEGFAQGQNQVFTYAQNFHCTIEPFDDLDGVGRGGDGVPAASDPDEMVIPECIAGETAGGSAPTVNPAGQAVSESRKFWAIVPTFDANGNGLPEALDPKPGVDLQCPEPGAPVSEKAQPTGACTMHPSVVVVDPIVDEIGTSLTGLPLPSIPTAPGVPGELPLTPPVDAPTVGPGVIIPLPGHSHIAETTDDPNVWWQVIVVLVRDQTVWPDKDGNCAAGRDKCLTSLDALRTAQAAGDATAGRDIGTNLWLFFANQPEEGPVGEDAPVGHAGMHHG